MLMSAESLVAQRAFFASKHLFVTAYEEGQLYPAGDHVVQSETCLGLKEWVKEVRGGPDLAVLQEYILLWCAVMYIVLLKRCQGCMLVNSVLADKYHIWLVQMACVRCCNLIPC